MDSLQISVEMILFITSSCHGGKVSPASTFIQPPMLPDIHPMMWFC